MCFGRRVGGEEEVERRLSTAMGWEHASNAMLKGVDFGGGQVFIN